MTGEENRLEPLDIFLGRFAVFAMFASLLQNWTVSTRPSLQPHVPVTALI